MRKTLRKKTDSGMEVFLVPLIFKRVEDTIRQKVLFKIFKFVRKIIKLKFLFFTYGNESLFEILIRKCEF